MTWGLGIGGGFGALLARRVQMTKMPQLVAFFHSLVGLAAVLVAAAALFAPQAFGIGIPGDIHPASLIEMSLGAGHRRRHLHRLHHRLPQARRPHEGQADLLPQRHSINLALGVGPGAVHHRLLRQRQPPAVPAIVLIALALGVLLIIPIGGADMPVVVSMLNSYSGWAAAGIGFTLGNMALIITGALVGSSGAILSYIMCKGMNR